jgi:hypothetical protein
MDYRLTSRKEAVVTTRKTALKADHFKAGLIAKRDGARRLHQETLRRTKEKRRLSDGPQYVLEELAVQAQQRLAGLSALRPTQLRVKAKRLRAEKGEPGDLLSVAITFGTICASLQTAWRSARTAPSYLTPFPRLSHGTRIKTCLQTFLISMVQMISRTQKRRSRILAPTSTCRRWRNSKGVSVHRVK